MRDDLFTVVFDQVKTDTAMYADVVLPGDDVFGELRHRAGVWSCDADGAAGDRRWLARRANMEVFSDLASRLDIEGMPGAPSWRQSRRPTRKRCCAC